MSLPTPRRLYQSVEKCHDDAIDAWRKEHAPGVPLQDLFATAISSVTVELTLFPRGRASVITTVRGRRQFDDETNVFRLNTTPQTGWKRVGSSLTSTSR